MAKKPVRISFLILSSLWLLSLSAGSWMLMQYSITPGEAARTVKRWPTDSQISRKSPLAKLLLFIHPSCPCSRASVAELVRLLPQIAGKVDTYVVFFNPLGSADDLADSNLWRNVADQKSVGKFIDKDGQEARRFGVLTSGEVLFYAADGTLLFAGGITPERGHEGDSDGRETILSFVHEGKALTNKTPVFGCSLRNPERAVAGAIK